MLQTCDPIGFDIYFFRRKTYRNQRSSTHPPTKQPNNQEDEQIIASLTQDLQKLRKATRNYGHPVRNDVMNPGAISREMKDENNVRIIRDDIITIVVKWLGR